MSHRYHLLMYSCLTEIICSNWHHTEKENTKPLQVISSPELLPRMVPLSQIPEHFPHSKYFQNFQDKSETFFQFWWGSITFKSANCRVIPVQLDIVGSSGLLPYPYASKLFRSRWVQITLRMAIPLPLLPHPTVHSACFYCSWCLMFLILPLCTLVYIYIYPPTSSLRPDTRLLKTASKSLLPFF